MLSDLLFRTLAAWVRIALAAVALVGAPLADAVTCTGDNPPAAMTGVADVQESFGNLYHPTADKSDHEKSGKGDVQHCVHGHCHQPAAPQPAIETGMLQVAEAVIDRADDPIALAKAATGLERPPKA